MIVRFNLKGKAPKMYKDVITASRATGIRSNDIKRVTMEQRRTAGGYQWKNVEVEDLTK
jgi:hypothetical protein